MTKRLTSWAAITCLALAPLAVAAPAEAAWTNMMQIHGGKLQLCKVPLGDGRTRLKVRLDNRGASHTHLGGISRTRDGRRVDVNHRTAAGRTSDVRTIVVRRGDQLVAGMGETSGEGAGGDFALSGVARC